MSSADSWDEESPEFMDAIAEQVAIEVPKVFADQDTTTSQGKTHALKLNVKPVHKLPSKVLNACLTVLDQNLNEHYTRHNGKDWKIEKREEMSQNGLVYIYYKDQDTGNIAAFISFMVTYYEPELKVNKVLYLYEIHVAKYYQSLGLGAKLIHSFHSLAESLDSNESLENDGTCLTVFSDNERALKWYKKLDYTLTEDSPRDKVLRNRKVVKPPYYILMRKSNE